MHKGVAPNAVQSGNNNDSDSEPPPSDCVQAYQVSLDIDFIDKIL